MDSEEFLEAWKIYEDSFPSDERRTLEAQKKVMNLKEYSFFVVMENNNVIGLITEWNFGSFSFIEHLAVKKELRNKGNGSRLLKSFVSEKEEFVVLEVELPEDEISKRRIGFYERVGFKLNDFDYIQPSYGEGKSPVPMLIMTYPKKITEKEFLDIREKVHKKVYSLEEPLVKL